MARKRHDQWCAYTRRVMSNDLSTLFVLAAPVPIEGIDEITAALARFNPRKRVLVLNGPENDHGDDWTGNHEVWDKHLSPFEVHPPVLLRANYIFHRVRTNATRMIPRSWRDPL